MSNFPYQETPYGFQWGPVLIERCASDPKWGVILTLKTQKGTAEVRVTPSGIVRYSLGAK